MQSNYKTTHDWRWVLAQFSFSLITLALFLYHGPMGIIIVPFVLWKFGHPETIIVFYQSFYTASDKVYLSYKNMPEYDCSKFYFYLFHFMRAFFLHNFGS